MKRITCQDPIVASVVGVQEKSQATYRWFTYIIDRDCDAGRLLYNTLTCELILINPEELNSAVHDQLIAKWFMVPEDFDDYAFAKRVKSIRQLVYKGEMLNRKNDPIQRYWILTTTYCNANCFYCHEKGIPKTQMTVSTADKVIEYIAKQNEKRIYVMWYGGEPLVNAAIIDYISEKIRNLGITIESSMISNGFLIDSQLAVKAVDLWNLRNIQITLDGMAATYNSVKSYVDKSDRDPFSVVIGNIGMLIEKGVNVKIRLNLDDHNKDELSRLVDYLYEKFGTYHNFSMYSATLFEDCLGTTHKREAEDRKRIFKVNQELCERIRKYNVLSRSELPKVLRSQMRCLAVSNVRVIFPDGRFAFCHDYSEGIMSGDIYGHEPEWDERMEYTRVLDDEEKCHKCVKYPHCVRFEKCFDNKCTEDLINEWEWNTQNEMLWEYEG